MTYKTKKPTDQVGLMRNKQHTEAIVSRLNRLSSASKMMADHKIITRVADAKVTLRVPEIARVGVSMFKAALCYSFTKCFKTLKASGNRTRQ